MLRKIKPNIRQNVKVRGSYWQHRKRLISNNKDRKKSENQAQNLISRVAKLKEGWLLNPSQSASSTSISKLGPISRIWTRWQKRKPCSDKKESCNIIVRVYRNESPDWNGTKSTFLGNCITRERGYQVFWGLLGKSSVLTLLVKDLKHHHSPS